MGAESTKSSKHRFTASNAQLEEHSHRWESRNLLTMATWGWDSAEESFLAKNMYKMKKKKGFFCLNENKIALHFNIFVILCHAAKNVMLTFLETNHFEV